MLRSRLSSGGRVASVIALFTLGVVGGGIGGCASHAELPPQVSQNLVDLRDHITRGKAQVQTTCNAARDVAQRPQSDVRPQVDKLLREIDALQAVASSSRREYATAQEQAKDYFARWDAEMAGMSESLERAGQERRAESMASVQTLKNRVEDLKAEARPMMDQLQEAAKYLRVDSTASGVAVARKQIDSAVSRERAIMRKADAVIEQIDAMRGGK